MPLSPVNLAVLVGGAGTTLQNLIDEIDAGRLDARIELVIASKVGIGAIDRAQRANLPVEVERSSERIFHLCDRADIDLVCLAGWMRLLQIPRRYDNRVINIHPSLLPKFGGKGMYGLRVHQAVIDAREKITGCTVHFVDADYDAGPIILQRRCAVHEDDTAQSLASRVFAQEKIAYPEAIRRFAARGNRT